MQQKLLKSIAIFLVAIILYSVSGNVISYAVDNLLTENELESQGTATNNKNVGVDVYFAEGKHAQVADLSDTEQKINVKVEVKEAGYLENITVDFSDANFKISSDGEQSAIQTIDEQNNKLVLNRINGGETITVSLKIIPNIKDQVSSNFFNRDNTVTFTGTYVNEKEKEKNVSKEIVLHTEWSSEAEAEISQSVTKYIPYTIENESGVLLQTTITTNVKNSILPIKTSHIEIEIPKIAETLPEKVIVVADKTQATNGKANGIEFTSDNWNYDTEKGMVTIDVSNLEGDTISWIKNAQDEYNVICVYSADVLSKVQNAGTTVNLKSSVKNTLYSNAEKEVEKTTEGTATLKEEIGKIVDVKTEIIEDTISKGYMYTNKVATDENKKETIYNEKYEIYVPNVDVVDVIQIREQQEGLSGSTGSTGAIVASSYVQNKVLKINKKQIEKMLGANGAIRILVGETEVKAITRDTESNREGKVEIDLSNTVAANELITIKISNVAAEGNLEIEIQKAIDKNLEFTTKEIKSFVTLNSLTNATATKNENNLSINVENDTAELVEPTSKASISINKTNLSTVVKNNNVEITAILETDSIDDLLYQNPAIDIQLPSYITDANITNSQVLYTDELTITPATVVDGTTGKIIRVTLNGTQTKYNDTTTKGINIIINADLTVNKLTPSKTETIQMIYTNNNDTEARAVTTQVNFVAPTGLVTVNEISGYAEGKETISLVSEAEENSTASLDIYSEARTATVKGQIINNYENNITNTAILGIIPNVDKEGNTFNTTLTGAIKVSEVETTIYYSTNANATKDLNDAANGWTTSVQDYNLVKSYLIVANSQMEKGTEIAFEYTLSIPENLSYNNTNKLSYTVYYNNNSSIGTIAETAKSREITLTTGAGPNLEVTLETEPEIGNTVRQGQYVNFTATIKNTGTVDAEDVFINIIETEETKAKKYDIGTTGFEDIDSSIEIGIIRPNETITISYILSISYTADLNKNNGEITTGINVTMKNLNNPIEKRMQFKLLNGYISVVNKVNTFSEYKVSEGENVRFGLYLFNGSEAEVQDINVEYRISEGVTINQAGIVTYFSDEEINDENVVIDTENNIVTYTADKLSSIDKILLVIDVTVRNDIGNSIETVAKASGKYNGVEWEEYSNKHTLEIEQYNINLSVAKVEEDEQNVKEGTDITYEFAIKNTGDITSSNNEFECTIPEGVTFKNAEITIKDANGEIESETINETYSGKVNYFIIDLEKDQEVNIRVNVITNVFSDEEIESGIEEKEISAELRFLSYNVHDAMKVKSTYYLIYDEATHNKLVGKEEPTKPEETTYKINGRVWLDENKNDQRDNAETGLSGVEVILINAQTMEVAKDKDSKAEKIIKTSEDGIYEFTNLEVGKYMVAFLYDSNEYSISQYQKDGVASSINSDAIAKTITYKGETRTAGLTDILLIRDGNIRNIDLGLSKADKFNLNLEKKITKVTVNNTAGTEEYDYSSNPKQLSKVDIKDKLLSESTVIVEYTIKVTNTGTVPGYVKKIVDYIPADMKFSSELNKQWYLGTDGNAYDMELAEMPINPGESKEVVIILTKRMTDNNTGITNNNAELFEVYNEKGLVDIDSTPANKNTSENDMSTATIVVSVKTGQIVIYTTLTIVVIAILGLGVYEIKKHVLDKKI